MPVQLSTQGLCLFCSLRALCLRPSSASIRASRTSSRLQRNLIRSQSISKSYGTSSKTQGSPRTRGRNVSLRSSNRNEANLNQIALRRSIPPHRLKPLLLDRVQEILPKLKEVCTDVFELNAREFQDASHRFRRFVGNETDDHKNLAAYQSIIKARGSQGLNLEIKNRFMRFIADSSQKQRINQEKLADLRYPAEWYPGTRKIVREFHLHIGPTNSGKTYHALKRLEQAERGCYAGPLRLLAQEVYHRLNALGRACALSTGDEQRAPTVEWNPESPSEEFPMVSSTVEMTPMNHMFEVAVIDEIQMIGSADRGWAWTQAVLGVQAKEVHLCGEARTVPLIKELVSLTGDKLHIHEYKRLSPLEMAPSSLRGNLSELQKGDCVVVFTVIGIHAMKKEIEKKTGKKVAIVYGSLPAETRSQQAALFNDPDNDYDILVASDAIGMGLNLSIKRIIFETSWKFNGSSWGKIDTPSIKQIGGRAGRYRTARDATHKDNTGASLSAEVKGEDKKQPNVGLVTTLNVRDFSNISNAMSEEPPPITTAGIFPPDVVVERFASYWPPKTPFSFILTRLHELCQTNGRFHLCDLKDQIMIADEIQSVEGLSINDRIIMCASPANPRQLGSTDNPAGMSIIKELAVAIAEQRGGDLLDLKALNLDILDRPIRADSNLLRELEFLHKGLILYLWLSYRFPGVFRSRPVAFYAKSLAEDKIEKLLSEISILRRKSHKISPRREEIMQENAAGFIEQAIGAQADGTADYGIGQPLGTVASMDAEAVRDMEQMKHRPHERAHPEQLYSAQGSNNSETRREVSQAS